MPNKTKDILTSLEIENFRGFEHLSIPKLARVNLIAGKNNTGKTGVLEALFLLFPEQEGIEKFPQMLRSESGIDENKYFWRWLTYNCDSKRNIEISSAAGDQVFNTFTFGNSVSPGENFSVVRGMRDKKLWRDGNAERPVVTVFSNRSMPPIAEALLYTSAAKKSGGEEKIERLLAAIEPRLRRVRAFVDEQNKPPLIHVDIGLPESIPSSQLGQGFTRLLTIYSALIRADSDIILIDEIENGLHHSVLPTVWKGLATVAREENVQIFATTHSWECVMAAHEVFSSEPEYDFALHRLERKKEGGIHAVSLEKEALDAADSEEWEVR